MGLGLVQVDLDPAKPPAHIAAEAEAQKQKESAIGDALGQILHQRFQSWADARKNIEDEWIKDLRAFNGIYEPDIKQAIGNKTDVYMHLTRTKTLAAYARITDMLLGHDRHWSIEPTPVPELDDERKQELLARIAQVDPEYQLGATPEQIEEDLLEVENVLAKEAAEAMQTEIEDQLAEAMYQEIFKVSTMECSLLGSGAMKGPTVKIKRKPKWMRNRQAGSWDLEYKEKIVPGIDGPSIFDLYPDPYATDMSEEALTGMFERHVMTAYHMRGLSNYQGFRTEKIEEVIRYYPNGNHVDFQHERDRRNIANIQDSIALNRRYDVIEYWGQVTGQELSSAGFEVHEDKLTQEMHANVWFSAACTLKVQLNPMKPQRIPYQIVRYEKVPHQFWGVGVPRQMRDSQTVLNTAVRATLDNLAISSGPQVEVNQDLLAPGEDPRDLRPWRVWVRETGDPMAPLLRVYNLENIVAHLTGVIEMMRKFMDEETSLPSYTHGEQMPGLNKTASGMSMLMGAANVALKTVIKNFDDDLIKPIIRGMYDFNMQWNDKESIKGDMDVKAHGSTSLLAKEVQSQRLIQYLAMTANPFDAQLLGPVKRAKALREAAISMDLNPDEVGPDDPDKKPAAGPATQPGGGGGVVSPEQPPAVAAPDAVPGAPPVPQAA